MHKFNRRSFIRQATAAGGTIALGPLAGGLTGGTGSKGGAKPPNILFLYTDQQHWDTIDAYGEPIFPGLTPNLDRLASEGVLFRHAFTNQPVCGPARACLQTGRYATETGCYTNDVALPTDEKTMAHYLSAGGYEVGYMGKLHLASQYTYGVWPEKGYGPADEYLNTPDTRNLLDAPMPPEFRCGYRDFWLATDSLEYSTRPYHGHMYDGDGNKREYHDHYRVDAQTDWLIHHWPKCARGWQ